MHTNSNTVTLIDSKLGCIIGIIGVFCCAVSLGMIWTTRDVARMQSEQQEWMRDRINQLEGRVAVLEAYQFQRTQAEQK
jgi:hypothetical protein